MSASVIGTASGSATTTTNPTGTLSANTVTGDTVVLIFVDNATTNKVSSVTATGMTFTNIAALSGLIGGGAASYGGVYIAQNVTGATTPVITVTKTGSCSLQFVAIIIRGLTTTPQDKTSRATAANTTTETSGSTATLTQQSEAVIGFGYSDAGTGQTYTVGSGYSSLKSIVAVAGDVALQFKAVNATTAVSSSMTLGTATDNAGGVLTLLVAIVNPTVVSSAATSIGQTTATLNGNITATGSSSVIVIEGFSLTPAAISTSPNLFTPGVQNINVTPSGTTGTYSTNVTGLLPNTTYYYTCYAGNADNNLFSYPTSSAQSFTTNPRGEIITDSGSGFSATPNQAGNRAGNF